MAQEQRTVRLLTLSTVRLDPNTFIERDLIKFFAYFLISSRMYSGDVPMTRVKMNAKHEYEYIANFKVMQNVFKAKKIDKVRDQNMSCAQLPIFI